jgi:hypothetical protein
MVASSGPSSGGSSSRDNDGMAAAAKAISGMGAGVLSTMLCSPLDVAKTRVQVQTVGGGDVRYRGVLGALSTILREEGLAGWFRGIAPAVSSVAVFWAVYFPCYDAAKEKVVETTGLDGMPKGSLARSWPCGHRSRGPPAGSERSCSSAQGPRGPGGPRGRGALAARMPSRRRWWRSAALANAADLTAVGHAGLPATSSLVHCSAAALAGGLTDVMTNPLWLVRTRMATSRMRAEVDSAKAKAAGEAGRAAAAAEYAAAAAEYATMASTIRTIARDEGMARRTPHAPRPTPHAPRPTPRHTHAPRPTTRTQQAHHKHLTGSPPCHLSPPRSLGGRLGSSRGCKRPSSACRTS